MKSEFSFKTAMQQSIKKRGNKIIFALTVKQHLTTDFSE